MSRHRAGGLAGFLLVWMVACTAAPVAQHPSPSASSSPTPAPAVAPASPLPSPTPTLIPAPSPAPKPATSASARTVSAIQPKNAPTGITSQSNGQVDQSLLVYTDPKCMAYRPDATSLARLFTIARAEGVALGANECYRPIDLQAAARTSNCNAGNCACAGPPGHSMHGWGEAVDLRDENGSINTFTSPTYQWLVQSAARFGWNHPGWAVPGGSPCPEPWHWEWVGDGGILHAGPIRADVVSLVPSHTGQGYGIVTGQEAVAAHGDAGGAGGGVPANAHLTRLIVAGAADPAGDGYWLAAADGTVYALGGAPALGSVPSSGTVGSGPTITAIAPTPSGQGYWLVSADGKVLPFGDAPALNAPAGTTGYFMGAASTSSGKGLWLAASNGTVVALGDATPCGPATTTPTDPIVAIAATPGGHGCWLSSANGKVSAFGDAGALGDILSVPAEPVVSMSSTHSGHGYWLVTAGGDVYAFGDAGYFGNG